MGAISTSYEEFLILLKTMAKPAGISMRNGCIINYGRKNLEAIAKDLSTQLKEYHFNIKKKQNYSEPW